MNDSLDGECSWLDADGLEHSRRQSGRRMHRSVAARAAQNVKRLRMCSYRCLVVLTILIGLSRAGLAANDLYTKEMFVQGLKKGGFVLMTLVDGRDGSHRRVAALEAGLLGAIRLQQHIDYDETGRQRAEEIALKQWNQPFRFTNKKAFSAVKPSYTTSQLGEIRSKLSKYDRAALQKQLDDPDGAVHRLHTHPYRESYRDAVAQVLLERGVLVGVDDRTPTLRPLEH